MSEAVSSTWDLISRRTVVTKNHWQDFSSSSARQLILPADRTDSPQKFCIQNIIDLYLLWGFHGGDVSRRSLLVSDAVYCCGRIPTFRRSAPHREDGGSTELRNVGTRRHNPEDLSLKHHRLESLKTRKSTFSLICTCYRKQNLFCVTFLYYLNTVAGPIVFISLPSLGQEPG
jgi:hypothetical protein